MSNLVPGMSLLIQDSYENFTKYGAYLGSLFALLCQASDYCETSDILEWILTFILCVTQQEL